MSIAHDPADPARLDALRRRTVRALVLGVALGSTGHIAALTIAAIVAEQVSGSKALGGAPAAAVVLGAALGATVLSSLMARRGRRIGLATGYATGVAGAVIAIAGVVGSSLPVLLAGSVLIGFGNSSNQLSRYAAADMFPPDRRATAIGTVVWAATVGAVIGPNLIDPSGDVAAMLGLPRFAGPYLVPILVVTIAAVASFTLLRPDPYALADRSSSEHDSAAGPAPLADVVRRPAVITAILSLVASMFVMVLIMAMTPLHMNDHGHDLGAIGLVLSGHTFGMYALAPLSGRLTSRFGCIRVIYAGTAVIALAGLISAAAPAASDELLFVALFLLGFGWNLGFVAGSAMLSGGLALAERTRVQGLVDGLIWSTAAIASLGSGFLVAGAGYAVLGVLGAIIVVVPAAVIAYRRRSLTEEVPSAVFEPIAD